MIHDHTPSWQPAPPAMNEHGSSDKPYRTVRRTSPYPLYWQVEHDLRERIADGVLARGERIPSEQKLSDLYGASRITIRQALSNLASEGLVSREPGRGTFVRDDNLGAATRQFRSFTSEMMRSGLRLKTRVLHQGVVPAHGTLVDRFGIEEGTPVFRVDRLREADGEPIALQRSNLPADRFPGLDSADLTGSLYSHLLEAYGVEPVEADEVIKVTSPGEDREAVAALEITADSCVFLIERLSYDDVGPIDYSRSLVRGDRYQFNHRLRYTR